jgi:hypothetical protein
MTQSKAKTRVERLLGASLIGNRGPRCARLSDGIGARLLVDLFPEPAAVRNVWKNELSFVERERAGLFVLTER